MTENEIVKQAIRCIVGACDETCKGYDAKKSVCHGYSEVASGLETVLKDYEQYRAIGTVYECRVAVEKMKPWEVQYHEFGRDEGYPYCKCGKRLTDNLVGVNYCPECGQKLDWEE